MMKPFYFAVVAQQQIGETRAKSAVWDKRLNVKKENVKFNQYIK